MPLNPATSNFKRKFPRRLFVSAVGVLFNGQYQLTNATSLSEGGIAFIWPEKLQPNLQVVVTFRIPGESLCSIRSEIKNAKSQDGNARNFIIGVQFIDLPVADKRRIRSYVSSRADNEPVV